MNADGTSLVDSALVPLAAIVATITFVWIII